MRAGTARWEQLPDDGNRYADGALVSPTLPFHATVADFFAGAPDTTL
jgi:hypothetical protein